VDQLESLQAVAAFSLFAHNVKDGIDQLCSFSVVALRPVITSTGLAEDKIVWSKRRKP
jgi:hypothetical protein